MLVELYFPNKANVTPIKKHPNRLTVNVAQGKFWLYISLIVSEIAYHATPPMKLPKPTANNDFIIVLKGFDFAKTYLFVLRSLFAH